jgi:ferric-dicitrate binding protein FerR (iron transport regulator)
VKNEIEINDELIARYLSGEASPEEAIALSDWLSDPVNRSHFEGLQQAWNSVSTGKTNRAIDVERAWRIVDARKDNQHRSQRTFLLENPNIIKIAAAVTIIVSVAAVLYLSFQKELPVQLIAATTDSLQHITFSDYSTAVVNRNSQLTYPERFETDRRQVTLMKGEVFFRVTADASKPFIVNTSTVSIKVIGTAFNVVVNDQSVSVSVDEGKVLVFSPTDSIYLEPGNAASFDQVEQEFNLAKSNRNDWAYASGKLVFFNTPLLEVFDQIEKAQNCKIQAADPDIGNCKLTATFESVSTDYMLNLIAEALNLSVTRDDKRTFKVEGNGCH